MEKLDFIYFRYMDYVLILAHTRWKLKKAIRILNQTSLELKMEKHQGKTLMARIGRTSDTNFTTPKALIKKFRAPNNRSFIH